MDKNYNSKKSQSEAFGLVLIVGLVSVIFIIMVRIESTRSPSEIAQQYEVTALSSSTINTFLNTAATDCGRGKKFSDIAIDCMRNPNSYCGNTNILACNYFAYHMYTVFEIVFDRAGLDYEVRFDSVGRNLPEIFQEKIPPSGASCAVGLRGEEFRLPINPGELTINLAVCRAN